MSAQTRRTQHLVRTALALALAGLLTILGGGLMLTQGQGAAADPGGQDKVAVCHRTASEGNPYTYLEVPEDEANGHITGTSKQHNTKVVWKTDGTWRGVAHRAGDLKLDYLAQADEIAARKCFDPATPPPTEPEEVTPPAPTFADTCDPGNEQLVVPADDGVVAYSEPVRTGDVITVTATSADPTLYVLVDPVSGEVVKTVTWTFTVDDQPCPTTPPTVTPPTVTPPATVTPEVAPSTGATEDPSEEPAEESESPEVLPAEASQSPTASQQVPTAVDAGYAGWSTAELWAAALMGGGLALLVSSGAVLAVSRTERGRVS